MKRAQQQQEEVEMRECTFKPRIRGESEYSQSRNAAVKSTESAQKLRGPGAGNKCKELYKQAVVKQG